MRTSARKVVEEAAPRSIRDTFIRVAKTAVGAFCAFLLKRGLDHGLDTATLRAAIDAAWAAGGTFFLNVVLAWASS